MFATPASGADDAVSTKSNMFSLTGQKFFGDVGRSLSLGKCTSKSFGYQIYSGTCA